MWRHNMVYLLPYPYQPTNMGKPPPQHLTHNTPASPQLIVGDLNLHHPLWDRAGRTTPESDVLLTLAYRWRLKLITPWGEPTRRRHRERDSTIDHAWVTATLPYRYWGDLSCEGSDHRAQLIELTTPSPARRHRAAEAPGWSWNSMDRDLVAIEAKGLHLLPTSLDSPDQIDEAVDYLTAQLTHIADVSTPQRKASQGRGEPWWDAEVHDALHHTRSARRHYAASLTEPNWRSLQDACTQQL